MQFYKWLGGAQMAEASMECISKSQLHGLYLDQLKECHTGFFVSQGPKFT